MITRSELMEWLNTCPDHHWDIVHEDEGHMRVLFPFDDEDDDDLVLSDHERNALLVYYTDNCLPEYLAEKEEDFWHGVTTHFGLQVGDRMFDLKVWLDDQTKEIVCVVYECDWINDNWQTNCKREWVLTEEMK